MTDWTKYLGHNAGLPPASEPMRTLKEFLACDPVVDTARIQTVAVGWRVTTPPQGFLAQLFGQAQSVRLFETTVPRLERCLVVYRAAMKAEALSGRAYLEMWCRVNGREYFSKGFGFGQVTTASADWLVYETPFLLKQGEVADFLRLNVAFKGGGSLLVKDVEVVYAPLVAS